MIKRAQLKILLHYWASIGRKKKLDWQISQNSFTTSFQQVFCAVLTTRQLHTRKMWNFQLGWTSCLSCQQVSPGRKHPYHPHRGNCKLTPLPPSDVLIHLLLSETILSPLPLRTAEISSVGGVWIFSGTTYFSCNRIAVFNSIYYRSCGIGKIVSAGRDNSAHVSALVI
jgi:hypothetical protein